MNVVYEKETSALLVIDPYNDFISEGGKLWDRLKAVAEANDCVPHMLQVLNAARKAGLRIFYAMHHRYRPGDYETWKYIAPIQKAAWANKTFELCGATATANSWGNVDLVPGVKVNTDAMGRLAQLGREGYVQIKE